MNNVRQEPGVAYTVSGTALTMTGSIVATDDFYVVFQGPATGTATHPAGSNLEAVDGEFSGYVAHNDYWRHNRPFWENTTTINTDYTITNNRNALSIGPDYVASRH